MLVPAGLLVLVVLGAVCVDAAATYLSQRHLSNAAEAAATGAAGAISDYAFYRSGRIVLDPGQATTIARRTVSEEDLGDVTLDGPPEVQVSGRYVCVSVIGRARRIFGAGLPGVTPWTTVRAAATAEAAGTGGGTGAQPRC